MKIEATWSLWYNSECVCLMLKKKKKYFRHNNGNECKHPCIEFLQNHWTKLTFSTEAIDNKYITQTIYSLGNAKIDSVNMNIMTKQMCYSIGWQFHFNISYNLRKSNLIRRWFRIFSVSCLFINHRLWNSIKFVTFMICSFIYCSILRRFVYVYLTCFIVDGVCGAFRQKEKENF